MVFRVLWTILVGAALVVPGAPSAAEEPATTSSAPSKPNPAAVAAWRKQLLEIRKLFIAERGNQEELGREKLTDIDDPVAAHAIVKLLETEQHGKFRRALIPPLIQIGGRPAVPALVKWSVEDTNGYFRQEACHALAEKAEIGEYLEVYLGYLKQVRQGFNVRFATEAAEALTMTRLAAPLGIGEKPNEKLVRGLVGALNTAKVEVKQAYVLGRPVIPDPRDSPERRKRRTPLADKLPVVLTPNPVVLATLQDYTGEDFQYDQSAWLAWLEKQLKE